MLVIRDAPQELVCLDHDDLGRGRYARPLRNCGDVIAFLGATAVLREDGYMRGAGSAASI